ncbi:TPA: hypothetical protein HA351_01380 [Methanosarcinaceae archaeon]|nr:hypothetical protein [Methanosarcinaceae archaeon]
MDKRESASDKLRRRLEEQKTRQEFFNVESSPAPGPESTSIPGSCPAGASSVEYDGKLIAKAIDEALKNPRIGAWSPRSAMILNYIKFTRPMGKGSLSSEIDEILTRGLISRYPELHKAIGEVMGEKQIEIPKKKGKK